MSYETPVRTVPSSSLWIAAAALAVAGYAMLGGRPADRAQAAAPQDGTPAEAPRAGFARPLRSFTLPPLLQEISAVTCIDEHTVACVQDEKGVLFRIDLRDGRLIAAHPFGPDGDYEGLARVGTDYYALRSDGVLARIAPRGSGYHIVETFRVSTDNDDFEGLCHDPERGLLLLAPKDVANAEPEEPGAQEPQTRRTKRARGQDAAESRPARPAASRRQQRDQRVIYGWDLRTRTLLPEPVLRLSVDELRRQAEARGFDVPTRTTRRGQERPALKLLFSCVAVHPRTGDVFLLSAADQTLTIVARDGALRSLHRLDPDLLPQPEGLTFLPGGDLVVSSEGGDGPARLAVFRLP